MASSFMIYLISYTCYIAHMLESIGVHGTNLLELVDTQLDLVDNQLLSSEHGNRGGGSGNGSGGSGSNKRNRKKNSNLKSLLSLNPFKTQQQQGQGQGQQGKLTRSQGSSSVDIGAAVTTSPLHAQLQERQQQPSQRHEYDKVPTTAAIEHPSTTSTTTPAHTEDTYYPLTDNPLPPHPQSQTHSSPQAQVKNSKKASVGDGKDSPERGEGKDSPKRGEGKDSPERGDESEEHDDRFSRTSSFQSLASSQVHTDDYLPRTSLTGGMGSGMGSGSKSVLRYRANTRGERVGADESSSAGAGGVLDGSRAALDNSSRLFLENAKIGEIICI